MSKAKILAAPPPVVIDETNLSRAWARLLLQVLNGAGTEVAPLMLSLSGFDQNGAAEDQAVRQALDRLRVVIDGKPFGAELTDNAYDPDGYRFHDVFHFAYAAVLGWSPISRALLRRKRKSRPLLDEVEDGGRAAVIEEGVAALAFEYARRHRFLEGVAALDFQLLRTIKDMTSHLEVRQCTTGEWEQAILQGFEVWRAVLATRGGRIIVELDERRITFQGPSTAQEPSA